MDRVSKNMDRDHSADGPGLEEYGPGPFSKWTGSRKIWTGTIRQMDRVSKNMDRDHSANGPGLEKYGPGPFGKWTGTRKIWTGSIWPIDGTRKIWNQCNLASNR